MFCVFIASTNVSCHNSHIVYHVKMEHGVVGMNCGLSAKGPNGIVRGDEGRPQPWWPLQILKSRKCDLWATLTKLTSFEEWIKNVKSRK